MAYRLIELFDIDMPLLYGEEEKAFTRLQEEIIKTYDDQSIYAWTSPPEWPDTDKDTLSLSDSLRYLSPHPVLAPSPIWFRKGTNVITSGRELGDLSGMTKHGLRISLRLGRFKPDCRTNIFERAWAHLNCRFI